MLGVTAGLLTACQSAEKQQTVVQKPAQVPQETCTVNGHDCWKVVKLLPQTKEVPGGGEQPAADDIWAQPKVTYENAALKKLGLTVTSYTMYRDGGSTAYVVNDEVVFRTNRSIGMPEKHGFVTVKFKGGPTYTYNPQGVLQKN